MLDRLRATNGGSKESRGQIAKVLLVLLICFLTLYAPIELTRVIADWGLTGKFIFEVCLIWILYIAAVCIISVMMIRER